MEAAVSPAANHEELWAHERGRVPHTPSHARPRHVHSLPPPLRLGVPRHAQHVQVVALPDAVPTAIYE
jgi:hypothetical protein